MQRMDLTPKDLRRKFKELHQVSKDSNAGGLVNPSKNVRGRARNGKSDEAFPPLRRGALPLALYRCRGPDLGTQVRAKPLDVEVLPGRYVVGQKVTNLLLYSRCGCRPQRYDHALFGMQPKMRVVVGRVEDGVQWGESLKAVE
eukprot:1805933-Pyramimonas_sp.AAC.1